MPIIFVSGWSLIGIYVYFPGVYGESHRHSRWLYCGENEDLTVFAIDIDIDAKPETEEGEPEKLELPCEIKTDHSQDSGLELAEDLPDKTMPGT